MEDRYKREVAYRIFAEDLNKSTIVPRGDGEYDAQYTKLPTGQDINRVFVCGALPFLSIHLHFVVELYYLQHS